MFQHVDKGKIIRKSNLIIHQALYSISFIGTRRFPLFLHVEMKNKKEVGRLGEHLKMHEVFVHLFGFFIIILLIYPEF